LAERFTNWLLLSGMSIRLVDLPRWNHQWSSADVEAKLSELAEMATKQWTGGFNPRVATPEEYLQIYRDSL
jgi:alcohol dehydrogenase class IV